MAKNILITGVSGYIGMKTAHALALRGDARRIVGIDIRPPDHPPDNLIFIKRDVRHPLDSIMKTHDIGTVIHAAYVLTPIHDRD